MNHSRPTPSMPKKKLLIDGLIPCYCDRIPIDGSAWSGKIRHTTDVEDAVAVFDLGRLRPTRRDPAEDCLWRNGDPHSVWNWTHSGSFADLVGTSMKGSKAVVRDAAIIGDRRTVATIRTGGVGAATPALEKYLSIPSCRYGVRAGRSAPQSKPHGFSFRLSSHRSRPKDGCRRRRGYDDESAGGCASLPALLGSLSTPKANWG
jgi:hypothetical protein